jgi:response regulator RpfG family c-di-GMP phosphodiesterase
VLDRLAHEARITPDQYQRCLSHAQRVKVRCEDAVVDLGYMTEADLLKYLAAIYRTRYVSTGKLAKAGIPAETLRLVPKKLCERLLCFPILYDRRGHVLSVVAADLEEHDVEKQVQVVSGAREVKVYVGRPAAVQALIRKYWEADAAAFAELGADADPRRASPGRRDPQVPTLGQQAPAADFTDYYDEPSIGSGLFDFQAAGLAETEAHARAQQQAPLAFTIEAPDIAAELARGIAEPKEPQGSMDYLGTLNVLVALLERERGELRGHSAQAARLCRKVCERIGLNDGQMHGILVAAYLHDIGKASAYHLTALNVAQYEGHRLVAQKAYLSPVRMFESVRLPENAVEAMTHLYERFDGQGFPDRQAGKEISLGARVLAIVETYLDLTTHAKNPFRQILTAKEACAAIAENKGTVFDPNLVDLFQTVVLGDDLRAKLLADRPTVLIVDPDPEETTVLELRLIEHGFDVAIARSATDAIRRLEEGGVDAVVTEVDLTPTDGFVLCERIKLKNADIPVLFLTRRSDRDSVARGFELGGADFLVKPASADVVAAKTRQILSAQRPRSGGVSGSLSEMSLPDVVQVLSNGRKSGKLQIRSTGRAGEIDFADGAIWDAHFGNVRAEEALYAMLLLTDGEFTLDPQARPSQRVIHQTTESLLLEGMRRLDEGRR